MACELEPVNELGVEIEPKLKVVLLTPDELELLKTIKKNNKAVGAYDDSTGGAAYNDSTDSAAY